MVGPWKRQSHPAAPRAATATAERGEAPEGTQVASRGCPLCGSRRWTERYPPSGTAREDSDAYRCTSMDHGARPRVVACSGCGLHRVPEEEVSASLEAHYADVVDEGYLLNAEARRRTFLEAFRRLEGFLGKTKGRILDIGSYCGFFLEIAAENGWEASGVEPSRWAAGYAREVKGLDVRTGTLAEYRDLSASGFDAVVLWDVLEHLRDPAAALRDAHGRLREGGVLALSTLDIDSPVAKLLGRRWPWIMHMHLFYFGRRLTEDLLRKTGFELLAARPYTHYISLRYLLEKLAALAPRPLTWLLAALRRIAPPILVPIRLGDVKMFVARKAAVRALGREGR